MFCVTYRLLGNVIQIRAQQFKQKHLQKAAVN